jgi:DNA-binding MarR family transcriptional regulator
MTRLQDEIKQTRPFKSLQEEASLSIARTAALLEHAVGEALRPHGITPTQYNALRILRGAGPQGLCRNEIRDRLISPMPDATRLLDRLAEMGFLVRAREGEDRRYVRATITPAGREVIDRLDDVIHSLHREQLGHLGQARLRALVDLLEDARER